MNWITSGMIKKREIQFRKKSGEIITGLFSAKVISLDQW
jgi:hypothetical protein